ADDAVLYRRPVLYHRPVHYRRAFDCNVPADDAEVVYARVPDDRPLLYLAVASDVDAPFEAHLARECAPNYLFPATKRLRATSLNPHVGELWNRVAQVHPWPLFPVQEVGHRVQVPLGRPHVQPVSLHVVSVHWVPVDEVGNQVKPEIEPLPDLDHLLDLRLLEDLRYLRRDKVDAGVRHPGRCLVPGRLLHESPDPSRFVHVGDSVGLNVVDRCQDDDHERVSLFLEVQEVRQVELEQVVPLDDQECLLNAVVVHQDPDRIGAAHIVYSWLILDVDSRPHIVLIREPHPLPEVVEETPV